MSVICEEFGPGILPSQIDEEDVSLCQRIMELRRYRDSWAEVNSGVEQSKLTKGPMLEKVLEVQFARVKGQI